MNGPQENDKKNPLRMPPDWEPPYPSFESTFDPSATEVSMAIIGAQYGELNRERALDFAVGMAALMRQEGFADHVDISECRADSTGHAQIIATGYWLSPDGLSAFFDKPAFQACWTRNSGPGAGIGVFREVFNVPMPNFETLHSGTDHLAGVAHARKGISDPMMKHAYWGSMRDRIPASAGDRFDPDGETGIERSAPGRMVVRPGHNMAVIRSGQDLGAAAGMERQEYFDDIEPVLQAGMDFLRDDGRTEVSCHDCRFMTMLDADGNPTDHTYGLAFFRSLADLENWAENHPTHLAIFGAFLDFAPRYGPEMRSRFWHEVSVLPSGNQFAEYINCASGTGLTS